MGLIRFLIITICVLYIIRSLARIFLPMLFQSMIKKATQGQQQPQQPKKPEGTVRVEYIPKEHKGSVPDTEGEFVEYEEIKKS